MCHEVVYNPLIRELACSCYKCLEGIYMVKKNKTSKVQHNIAGEAEAWNAIAEGWHASIPLMRAWFAQATDLMLDLARLEVGKSVLDIAAGDCDQSMAAAKRVGPGGLVLAIDIADELLEIGARSAREAGFQNIQTRVMDGGNLDLPASSFDAVICRFALMYLPDPAAALRGMKRVLKPGGRVSVVVYGENGSPEFSCARSVVRRHLGLPETQSDAHSLGETALLQQTLKEGGLRNREIHALDLPIRMASAEECVRYLQASSPGLAELTLPLSPAEREQVWGEVHQALTAFEGAQGFEVMNHVIVAAGSAG
jgi:ubiquinone/menaquinone biosynthesis C-methylase UbiE